jgi:bifunctional non-homologous end joining protein LigD
MQGVSKMPTFQPMRLARRPEPFDHPDWIYEIKFDGFRALAYVEGGKCRLVSRRNHEYKSFHELCASIAAHLSGSTAILDGEIVCLDQFGRSQFYELMFRRGHPFFYSFDLLWLNGADLRGLPLVERKIRLRELIGPRNVNVSWPTSDIPTADAVFRRSNGRLFLLRRFREIWTHHPPNPQRGGTLMQSPN